MDFLVVHPVDCGCEQDKQNQQNYAAEQDCFARINPWAFFSRFAGSCRGTHSGFRMERIPYLGAFDEAGFQYQGTQFEKNWLRKFKAEVKLSLVDEAVMDGVESKFEAIRDTELVENVVQMVFHRLFADEELFADLPVAETLSYELNDFLLAFTE